MLVPLPPPYGFAKSKEVHSSLAKALGPNFKERGWKRQKGGSCAFVRTRPEGRPRPWVAT